MMPYIMIAPDVGLYVVHIYINSPSVWVPGQGPVVMHTAEQFGTDTNPETSPTKAWRFSSPPAFLNQSP